MLQDYTKSLIALRREIGILNENVWWTEGRVRWLNADGVPMNHENWHDRTVKSMQVLLDGQWLLLVNGARNRQFFNLPQGRWQVSCVPSEKFNYNVSENRFAAGHMGIWVLKQEA